MADESKLSAHQHEDTISAAEAMAMTGAERAALPGLQIIRDPENLPPEVLQRAQSRMDEIIRRDRKRGARKLREPSRRRQRRVLVRPPSRRPGPSTPRQVRCT